MLTLKVICLDLSSSPLEGNIGIYRVSKLSILNQNSMILGIYPKECDSGYSRGTCIPMFIAALFTIAKLWKQPRCPTTDEWIKKMWYLYTMEFYSAMKKNEILSFAMVRIDGTGEHHLE
jgi:hypothetical protein